MDPAARAPRPHITCPRCRATSWHPKDVELGYCGSCHWWTSDPALAPHDPNLIRADQGGGLRPAPQ